MPKFYAHHGEKVQRSFCNKLSVMVIFVIQKQEPYIPQPTKNLHVLDFV